MTMLNLTDPVPMPLVPPRPILGRSIGAALLLCADLIVAFLLLVAHWQRLTFLRQIRSYVPVPQQTLVASDRLIVLWSRISLLVAIPTAVAFLVWLYRAHQNLRAFRAEPLEFTPGDAVGSFFIPFINLVRPYQVMREVWQATDPGVPPSSPTSFRASRVSPIVMVWWLLFVGRNIPGWWMIMAARMGGSPLEKLISATYGALGLYLLTIPAACAAIALVVLIEGRQDALAVAGVKGQAGLRDADAGEIGTA